MLKLWSRFLAIQFHNWTSDIFLLRDSKTNYFCLCVTVVATNSFNRFYQNFVHRFWSRKSWSKLFKLFQNGRNFKYLKSNYWIMGQLGSCLGWSLVTFLMVNWSTEERVISWIPMTNGACVKFSSGQNTPLVP